MPSRTKSIQRKKTTAHTGGCLCGAVRFRARGVPAGVAHCHCSACRKAAGAPFVTFARFPIERIAFTKGKPKWRRSSAKARRGSCAKCGSQLAFQFFAHPERMSLAVGCFDRPERVKPERHIFVESKLPWLVITDGLPRHRRGYVAPRSG